MSFKYDPFGRRIYKSSSSGTSIYVYDGDNLVEETNSAGAAVARYSQGANIDGPLAMLRNSATSYYQADGIGSVTSLSNSAAALVQTYTFDSFGKQTASSGSLTNPFQYTARESDTETGLYYYRARYYDLNVGRFLSEDPIHFQGGTNFYAYVNNDPTDSVDPLGLLKVCCRDANLGIGPRIFAYISLVPPPCHCFLKTESGMTLGGYHDWYGGGSLGGLDFRRDDPSDKNAKNPSCTDIPGKSCENDAKANRALDRLNFNPLAGYGWGQFDAGTSNDAAAGLLKEAGISYTLPACAWGKTTGLNPHGPFWWLPPILY